MYVLQCVGMELQNRNADTAVLELHSHSPPVQAFQQSTHSP